MQHYIATPKVIHAVARRTITDDATLARCKPAWESWNWLYKLGGVIPAHYWSYKRDARDIGDPRDLPYFKDILEHGLSYATSPYDVIFWTNDDNILHPVALEEIRRHVALHDCGTASRVELKIDPSLLPEMYHPVTKFMEIGEPHVGRDILAFSVGWLERHWDMIPDFICGGWGWDLCMAALVRFVHGYKNVKVQDFFDIWPGCEMPYGLVMHIYHSPKWKEDEAKAGVEQPCNVHDRRLFEQWKKLYWPSLDMSKLTDFVWPVSAIIRSVRLQEHYDYQWTHLAKLQQDL